jgi:hypothetical protein
VNKVQLLVDEVTIADNYEARRFHTALLGGSKAKETNMQLIARQQRTPRVSSEIVRPMLLRFVLECGCRIAYAPVVLPNGTGCTTSAHGGARGLVAAIDRLEP